MRLIREGAIVCGRAFLTGGFFLAASLLAEILFKYETAGFLREFLPTWLFTMVFWVLLSVSLPFFSILHLFLKRNLPEGLIIRRSGLLHLLVPAAGLLCLSILLPDEIKSESLPPAVPIILLIFFLAAGEKAVFRTGMVAFAVIGCLFLFEFASYRKSGEAARPDSPNVLLIVSDTTRRDAFPFYGYKHRSAPFLSDLASRSLVFENASSSSSWTKPAMASLVSGRFMTDDPVHHGSARIRGMTLSMAELFRSRGYETFLYSANANASSFFNHANGYEHRVHSLPPRHAAISKFMVVRAYQDYYGGKTALQLKNNTATLQEYSAFLGLPINRVSAFYHENLTAAEKALPNIRKLTPDNEIYLRLRMEKLFLDTVRNETKSNPIYQPRRKSLLSSMLEGAYSGILKFYYLNLQHSDGHIEEHWIRDRELSLGSIAMLRRRDRSRPFFMHLQYMGPHSPYSTQLPYMLNHFDPSVDPVEDPPTEHTPPSRPAPRLSAERLRNMRANYDDCVRITDANIGLVLDYLRSEQLEKTTIVVFVSDHGEAFYEHFIYGHMNSLHAELVNIPLMFHWPDRIKPGRSVVPAMIADVFPSLAVLAAMEDPQLTPLDGKSLFDRSGKPLSDRGQYYATMATLVGGAWKMKRDNPAPFGVHTAVIGPEGKLIREAEESGIRYFFFSPGDAAEKRLALTRKQIESNPAAARLFVRLPRGPKT